MEVAFDGPVSVRSGVVETGSVVGAYRDVADGTVSHSFVRRHRTPVVISVASARRVGATFREIVITVRDNRISFLAASFAYYAFVSILPILLLTFVLVSTLRGEELARLVLRRVTTLTPTGSDIIRDALTGSTGRLELSVISFLALVWSAVKVFRSLDYAFSRIYDATNDPSLVEQLRDGIVVFAAMTVAAVLLVVVSIPTEFLSAWLPLGGLLDQVELFVGLLLAFFPLYYLLPPVRVSVLEALPGTVVAAGGWLVLQVVFGVYAEHATRYATYGALGGVLLFVVWLYVAGLLLLVGASVNAVLSR